MLKRFNRLLAILLIVILGLLYYRSAQKPEEEDKTQPAIVEPIPGSNLKQVKLAQEAAERLGIKTEEVRLAQDSRRVERKVVPYSSLIYDLEGKTWVYTSPEALTFVRQGVVVDYIEGENVYLSDGPVVKTKVVTVGVAELYGAETGVGK